MKRNSPKNKNRFVKATHKIKIIQKENTFTLKINDNNFSPQSIFFLFLLIGVYIIWCIQFWHIQDDNFITLRYVKNLINGNGLVFNPGERVEGYTNFLWLVILTLSAHLKINIVTFSQYLSILFGAISMFYAQKIFDLMIKESGLQQIDIKMKIVVRFVPALLIVLTGAFSYWAVSGMESTLFITLILAALFYLFKKSKNFNDPAIINNRISQNTNYLPSILLSLAALTRPEGLIFAAIIWGYRILNWLFVEKKTIINKNLIFEFLVFVIPVLCHYLFRYLYYGYILPNTFYAKANLDWRSIQHGLNYFYSFLKDYLIFGVALIIVGFSLLNKKTAFEIILLSILFFGYTLYVILVGGDVLALHRFWLPVLHIAYILLGLGLIQVYKITNRNLFYALFTTVIVFYGLNFWYKYDDIIKVKDKEIELVERMKFKSETIDKIQLRVNKKLTIATSTIGALSYYTDANVIDLLGLTDSYIAHDPQYIDYISNDMTNPWRERKYNVTYVLQRKPDYILFSTEAKPSAFAERAIFSSNQFFRNYFLKFIPISHGNHLYFFARKNNTQLQASNPMQLTEKINPGFVNQYINLLQAFTTYRTSFSKQSETNLINEINKFKILKPSFFADDYRVYGDVLSIQQNFTLARDSYNKAIETDSLNVLSYLGILNTFDPKTESEIAKKYFATMERLNLVLSLN